MKERERVQRNNIIRAISGDSFQGIGIIPDYFERERRENNIEQGIPEIMPELVGSDIERAIRRNDKLVSDLEHERCPRFTKEYPGSDPEDRGSVSFPPGKITRMEVE